MNTRLRWVKDVLWIMILLGALGGLFRLWFGLGPTTNLSDSFPWGLWKILNMVGGVALSTSGFTVGFLVYVLGLKQFKPLVKPAILIAFLGYGSSCLALLFDIGLPHRFWHPIVFWNEHSFLFEVFWCVLLYFTVTAIEISPVFLRSFGEKRISIILERFAFAIVIVGISLSSLHHSSLGSLFLVTPLRLHSFWYSPALPILFFTSAAGAGLMMVVLARMIYLWLYEFPSFSVRTGCPVPDAPSHPVSDTEVKRLSGVASIASWVLGIYLLVKISDLILSGSWKQIQAGQWETWLLSAELLTAALIPFALMRFARFRRSLSGLTFAAGSAVLGLVLNRLNVGIFGYFRDAGQIYFPSLTEWLLSASVIAGGLLVFLLCSEYLPIFGDSSYHPSKPLFFGNLKSAFQVPNIVLGKGLYRQTLIAVLVIPIGWWLLYPPYSAGEDSKWVKPSLGIDSQRETLLIDGNRINLKTVFHHTEHQERLGGDVSCENCHHLSLPGDQSTPCSRCHQKMTEQHQIFDHLQHMVFVAERENLTGLHPANHSCQECHTSGIAETRDSAKSCLDCHREDMSPSLKQVALPTKFATAVSFHQALHQTCINCHKKEAVRQGKPILDQCFNCHSSLTPRSIQAQNNLLENFGAKQMAVHLKNW